MLKSKLIITSTYLTYIDEHLILRINLTIHEIRCSTYIDETTVTANKYLR